MRYGKTLLSIILLGLISASLFFLFNENDKNLEAEKIVIAVSADNPPFTFIDTQGSQKPAGFEVDLVEEIGKRIGKAVQIKDMDFANIIASLQSGRADAAISAIEKTPERAANLDFSDDYYEAERSLVTKEMIKDQISWKDKAVGVQLGSSHEKFLKTLGLEHPSLSVASYNRIGEMVQDLKNNRLYGILIERPMATKLIQQEFFYQTALPLSGDFYAIALPKGSPLVKEVNKALREIKKDGTLDKITKKWLGD